MTVPRPRVGMGPPVWTGWGDTPVSVYWATQGPSAKLMPTTAPGQTVLPLGPTGSARMASTPTLVHVKTGTQVRNCEAFYPTQWQMQNCCIQVYIYFDFSKRPWVLCSANKEDHDFEYVKCFIREYYYAQSFSSHCIKMNVFGFIQRLLVTVWTLMNVPRPPVEMAPPAKTWRMRTAACVEQGTGGRSVRAILMSVPLNHVKMAPRKQWRYKLQITVNQL